MLVDVIVDVLVDVLVNVDVDVIVSRSPRKMQLHSQPFPLRRSKLHPPPVQPQYPLHDREAQAVAALSAAAGPGLAQAREQVGGDAGA